MSWVGWRCMACRHEMQLNQRWCPGCAYTVFEPIHDHERPEWVMPRADPAGVEFRVARSAPLT